MNEFAWLALYSVLVLCVSLLGGLVPFLGRVTHDRLQLYLSASAGVMLGASFFHVMPDAFEKSGPMLFGWWMSLGVVGLFCIERFIAPHSHEIDSAGHHHHHHDHAKAHEHALSMEEHTHECDHGHDHGHHIGQATDRRAAAPSVAGWMAVLGLTIHTFMNGVGLAGAVQTDSHDHGASLFFPGLAMFLAIVLHKPADALAISTVLTRKGVNRRLIFLVQCGFAAMIPIGAVAFLVLREAVTEGLQGQVTGAALSISAGTFLFIALSDLLPEVQFHKHDRVPLFLALTLGVILMGGIAYLEEHDEHGKESVGEVQGGRGNP